MKRAAVKPAILLSRGKFQFKSLHFHLSRPQKKIRPRLGCNFIQKFLSNILVGVADRGRLNQAGKDHRHRIDHRVSRSAPLRRGRRIL